MKAFWFSEAPIASAAFSSIPGSDALSWNLCLILNPGLLFFLVLLSHSIYIYSSSSFRKTISPQFLASCFPSLSERMTNCIIPGGCFYLRSLNYYITGQLRLPTRSPWALHFCTNAIFLVSPWLCLPASHLPLGKLSAVSEIAQSAQCPNSEECLPHSQLKGIRLRKTSPMAT